MFQIGYGKNIVSLATGGILSHLNVENEISAFVSFLWPQGNITTLGMEDLTRTARQIF